MSEALSSTEKRQEINVNNEEDSNGSCGEDEVNREKRDMKLDDGKTNPRIRITSRYDDTPCINFGVK